MLLSLIGKNSFYKLSLPAIVEGSYWISDYHGETEDKLVNIQGMNGKWEIISSNNARIVQAEGVVSHHYDVKKLTEDMVIDRIVLEENTVHFICVVNKKEIFALFCMPSYEKGMKCLKINEKASKITIGSSEEADIVHCAENNLVSQVHATLSKRSEKWILENFDNKFGTFVNHVSVPLSTEKQIKNGDVIFIAGLRIIIIGEYLFLNSPINRIKYNPDIFLTIDNLNAEDEEKEIEETDLDEITLYNEKDYFSRAPRIRNIIEHETIKIDPPPAAEKNEEFPMILTLGSTISTGIMMLVSTYASLNGMLNNNASINQVIPSIIIAVIMLISTIILPVAMNKYQKKMKKEKEEKRQKRYKKYIDSKITEIDRVMEKQKSTLFDNYVSAAKCAEIIVDQDSRLWERKVEDFDFLTVRLGTGDVPLDAEIVYPEERFTMDDDNLVDILNQVANKSKTMQDAPISFSFFQKNNASIIVKEDALMHDFINSIIIQLIAFHSYEDLKLVFLLRNRQDTRWEYVKKLPHTWNDTKQIRFFANEYSEMLDISKYLEEELKNREALSKNSEYASTVFSPYYLIISDDPERVKNLNGIMEIAKSKKNLGFSTLYITDNIVQLPNECKTFINIENDAKGEVFESEISSKNVKQFDPDIYNGYFFEDICQTIGNIPIKVTASTSAVLPNSYTFLEMYNVGKIEQLNISERWRTNDSTMSLRAPIGVDGMGMPIMLDVHEKFHGPHGLIAGSTGSGKSEFIITYILSLAINYHPNDVAFLLIDYKGGGLAGAFKKKDIVLPHLVGTITNIDKIGLQRSLDSIQSELRKRQIMFNEARNMTEESTIDIYKYQKLYHDGIVKTPIPHLFIICDEFAELKQQQEEFMDELISVARIGRSLGVHLILATQKPAGIVNEQIRSNSRFGICLKVQDREDSMDIIKRPDAIHLKRAGQFYLQVGNDEYFVLGQSGWSGALYFPTDIVKKEVDTSMEFITNTGNVIKKIDTVMQKKVSSSGDQITNIVKYIVQLAKNENIVNHQLWLDNVPEIIYTDDIKKKYAIEEEKNVINPVIGEFDDPFNQRQGVVSLDFKQDGNVIIFGNADSGKETLLSTIIFEIMMQHTPEEANIYIFDFGSEALRIFEESPNVGDVIFLDEKEKISRFFEMMRKEIKERKDILADYNGDYHLYVKSGKGTMPRIIIFMNNYEAFVETYEYEYEDTVLSLSREGLKYGISFVMTANSQADIRYRLMQNFKKQIALQLNNDDDYLNIFDNIGKKRPSSIFGRGLVQIDKEVYEFQTSRICEPEEYSEFVKEKIEYLQSRTQMKAKSIPTMPSKVEIEDVIDHLEDLSNVPIGINKNTLSVFKYNFKKDFITIISSQNVENTTQFLFCVTKQIMQKLLYINIGFFDAEGIILEKKDALKEEYQKFISNAQNNKKEYYLGVIVGIDKFFNAIEKDEYAFASDLNEISQNENCNFIIVDSAPKIKNHAFDAWYQSGVQADSGIWVGNGISDQYTINVSTMSREIVNNCGNSYGYVIMNGEPVMVKLLGVSNKEEKGD